MRPFVGISVLVCPSAVVLAGMLAGAGCTVDTSEGPDDAGAFDGDIDAASPVCATCLSQACTGQWAACFDDPGCLAVAKRASAGACVAPDSGAADGGVDPLALYGAFASCNDTNAGAGQTCATDCTGASLPAACTTDAVDSGASDASVDGAMDAPADDAASDAGAEDAAADASAADAGDLDAASDAGPAVPVNPVVACSSCIASECGDAKKACATGSECAAYLECSFAAADAVAVDECGRQHASGKTAAAELATCTRVGCSNACGF